MLIKMPYHKITKSNVGGGNMSDIDSLELKIVSDKDIEKLERIKELLAEIQQLRDEVFGKQEND